MEERTAQGELAAGELVPFNYRLLKGQGKPQRYGTQFAPAGWPARTAACRERLAKA